MSAATLRKASTTAARGELTETLRPRIARSQVARCCHWPVCVCCISAKVGSDVVVEREGVKVGLVYPQSFAKFSQSFRSCSCVSV